MLTATPGRIPLDESLTVPVTALVVALVVCANEAEAVKKRHTAARLR
jgi:hypothetical protein